MIKRFPFIQILTAMYIVCIAVYMVYNNTATEEQADFWKNYYWIVNKSAMEMTLVMNYVKNKTKSDWLFINFLVIQTAIIIAYFTFGLPTYLTWMKQNDVVIYSFFIGSFIALIMMWAISLWRVKDE